MRGLTAFLAGCVFGVGMALSGMTNPQRVLGFFDVLGGWDPTLAFVMGGAMVPMLIAWRIRARMTESVLGAPLPGPASETVDARLLGGAAAFGVGWGIVGLCPGAVAPALSYGGWPVALFFAAMLVGMGLARGLDARRAATA
ncbi:MAG: hypothetical protein EA355_10435 [Rhodobacteraceae bacterium]|nr:MAG: hypothetical protein EA355_10435 [Paracoccaceae bacterium]